MELFLLVVMKTYKITFWKCIKPSFNVALTTLVFIFLMSILMMEAYLKGAYIPPYMIIITVLWIVILCGPNLVLHINYYLNDRGLTICIDSKKKKISIRKKTGEIEFCFKDIANIVKSGLITEDNKVVITSTAWGHFYYYKIVLKDKQNVFLTRFLIQKLEKLFPDLPYEYRFQKFPLIKD